MKKKKKTMSSNFGRLKRDLIGGSLRICDKLVLDDALNLCVGNVTAGNVCGSLIANTLTEKESMQGIDVYGNINLQPGYFLNGSIVLELVDLDIDSLIVSNVACIGEVQSSIIREKTPSAGISLIGSEVRTSSDLMVSGDAVVMGGVGVGSSVTANTVVATNHVNAPHVNATIQVCSPSVITNLLQPKTGTDINVAGNLVINSTNEVCGPLVTQSVRAKNPILPVMVLGDLLLPGSDTDLDMDCGDLQNVNRISVDFIQGKSGSSIDFNSSVLDNVGTLRVDSIEGKSEAFIDFNCHTLNNVGTLEVDFIQAKNSGTVDFTCSTLTNIDTIVVDNIQAKSEGFIDFDCGTVGNIDTIVAHRFHAKDNGNVTIGNPGTTFTGPDAVTIGALASTVGPNAVAIGHLASATNTGVALGHLAGAADADSTSTGFFAFSIYGGTATGSMSLCGGPGGVAIGHMAAVVNGGIALGYMAMSVGGEIALTVPAAAPPGAPVAPPPATMLVPVTVNGFGPFLLPLY
jgi:hypothetical protein